MVKGYQLFDGGIMNYQTIHYDNNTHYAKLLRATENGQLISPRDKATREVIAPHIIVSHPRGRLLTYSSRKMSIGFAFMEWLQYVAGSDASAPLELFINNVSKFAKDGRITNAYGPRMYGMVQEIVDILRDDPASRRAVIQIYSSFDTIREHGDDIPPCTLSLQFLLRNGSLDMIVTMRSNDLIWGFTYDFFSFTMLQELIAVNIPTKLGTCIFRPGSMHYYVDTHQSTVDAILKEDKYTRPLTMKAMPPTKSSPMLIAAIHNRMAGFVSCSHDGYSLYNHAKEMVCDLKLDEYWADLVWASTSNLIKKYDPTSSALDDALLEIKGRAVKACADAYAY